MAKLGKHIYEQFNLESNNIDNNYAVFSNGVTLSGTAGFTAFGTTPSIDQLYYDVSSITNWTDVRFSLTFSTLDIIGEVEKIYDDLGGYASFSGLTESDKESLSKLFLIPKLERDLYYTEEEQKNQAKELLLNVQEDYQDEDLENNSEYLLNSDETDVQDFLNSEANFQGGTGGGSVSSVNGQSGVVMLALDDLSDVSNLSGAEENHILIYDGDNWTSELRPPLSIHEDSQNYLHYNSENGKLYLEQLAITDVTVLDSVTVSSDYFNNPINCDSHEEGDTVIFPNTENGTEVWIHNGGSDLTIDDYTLIKNPVNSDFYIRNLISGSDPISYDPSSGIISIAQSGSASNGYLSATDWNTFNDKVDSVNGKTGEIILSTSDINEGTNKYYCTDCLYEDLSAGTGLGFTNGVYFANINDGATGGSGSTNQLWSANKIYNELQLFGGTPSLNEVLLSGNITGGTSINISNGDKILFGDDDLEIYRDGINSLIINGNNKGVVITGLDTTLNINSTGFSINGPSQGMILDTSAPNPYIQSNNDSGWQGALNLSTGISANRSWTMPDRSGEVSLIGDSIININGISGTAVTLNLNDINNVDTTGATVGEYLQYNGTDWESQPVLKSWSWGAAANGETANSYLSKYPNLSTDNSPYVAFLDCKGLKMSYSSSGGSWIAELRVNGTASATMSISGATSSYTDIDVDIVAGDEISFYCSSDGVNTPSIEVLFQEV